MYHGRPDAAHKIKQDEFKASESVLNVIPKNPQIPHIPYKVDKPAMQKHVTEKGEVGIHKSRIGDVCGVGHFDGNDAELKEEGIQPGT